MIQKWDMGAGKNMHIDASVYRCMSCQEPKLDACEAWNNLNKSYEAKGLD